MVIDRREISSLLWLAKEAKLDDRLLGNILVGIRTGELIYSVVQIPKSDGGKRELHVPPPLVCIVQRAINKNVLSWISAHPCAFGFSGGGIVDAITPHLGSKILFSFDVVDAFDQISSGAVLRGLTEGRAVWIGGGRGVHYEYGHLSWFAANMVAEICTWENSLPQGAPTSPRLFDQAFKVADTVLAKLAENVGGVFTRYADNIFFSLRDKTHFPPKLERAVLRVLYRGEYGWHKLSVRRMDNGAVRMLGLNVMEGKISTPRDYKRRLRLAQHHVRYLLDRDLPFEEAWLRLKGQMGFGSLGILPNALVEGYASLEKEIEGM